MSYHSTDRRVVVVLGATGHQGGGVVRALLKSRSWLVKAGTRDPNSPKARRLLDEEQTSDSRLELVTIHPYSVDTMRHAFADAYAVFAVTGEAHPDKKIVNEDEMTHEIEAGRAIVKAAKECNVQHFVFSSLPDMMKTTSGRYPKLYHMDNKYAVEQIAREALGVKVTSIIPGFFYTNLEWRQYTRLQDDGVVRFCYPIPSNQVAQWTDPVRDMGAFAARVLELGVARTGGKTYLAMSQRISAKEMAETFTNVTGRPAVHSPISAEEFGDLASPSVGPAFREDAMQMMQWAASVSGNKIAYGSQDPETDTSASDLGLSASSFEDWLRNSGWTGPTQ